MKAHLICHTHWDREWYLTHEEFRAKLVRLIDGILEIIDTTPEYVSFMLDGQTIAIEDYLEIRPYNREKLFDALREGKIICGPWYILPDELLISGESHIRNYLAGSSVLGDTVEKMRIGYLPDSFGHPAQMPQIINGLGMDVMVFWRGTADFVKNTEFYWESPASGIRCLCIHMPCGYGNSGNLSGTEEEIFERVEKMVEILGAGTLTDTVLLMNGSDHITAQKDIVEVVRKINARSGEKFQVVLSTLPEFVKEVKSQLHDPETYTGEFRYGHRSMLLGGTLSTRMYLKQRNTEVEKGAEQYVEPLMAAEYLLGKRYDNKGFLEYMWKKILENQPHDSICGCSIDAVHSEMETRFDRVLQLEKTLFHDTFRRIEKDGEEETESTDILLFEPSQDCLPSYQEIVADMDKVLVQFVDFSRSVIVDRESEITHPNMPVKVVISDETGREIPCEIIRGEKTYTHRYQDHTMPEVYKTNRLTLGVKLPGFKCGIHALHIKCVSRSADDIAEYCTVQAEQGQKIENEYYEVSVEGGTLTVVDKKTGRVHRGVHKFIDKGVAGDEYTYSWPEEDSVFCLKDVTRTEIFKTGDLRQTLKITAELQIPEKLEADRRKRSGKLASCPVEMGVSLDAGTDRIDFVTRIDNRAEDHRLQVQFPSGACTEYTEAEDIFHITKRTVENEIPETWAEYPQTTHPVHGFVNVEDSRGGLAVTAGGIAEFEGVQEDGQTCLNLTLLRCVGWLSRTDLLTREGNGGWTIETPDGQCPGLHEFHYSISYHTGSWRDGKVYQILDKALKPAGIHQAECRIPDGKLGRDLEFLSELPSDVRLSAAKPSQDGTGLIFRMYSIAEKERKFQLSLPDGVQQAWRTNLAEEEPEEMALKDGCVDVQIRAGEIITIKLR